MITLTTDFGTSDHFVGAMKGVILGLAPRARIVDITHEIAPYIVSEAAFVIAQAWQCFPKRTIHVVVVDPGVGSERRPILAEAAGHYFIAPDNGVLSMIYEASKPKVRIISNPKLMSKQITRTFHGRDVFAPAAAHLERGVLPAKFGKPVTDFIRLPGTEPFKVSRNTWTGTVLKVDRFGNLITNLQIGELSGANINLGIGKKRIRRLALTYAETDIGEVFAIVGSSGYLEVGANQGSASKALGCGAGARVELEIIWPHNPDNQAPGDGDTSDTLDR